MDKRDVIYFFDNLAESWDKNINRNEKVIQKILDNGGVKAGVNVLDVACGTGVLFPDYIKRNVNSITAIDISPKMVEIARKKFPDINIICGDVENTAFDKTFDCVTVYNAFPHFPNPRNLIKALADLTAVGGRLSVAHGMSREALKVHHKNASHVSLALPDADDLANLFSEWFEIETAISNDKFYQVVGIKKDE